MVSSVSPSPVLPDFESHDEHEVQNNSSDSPEACFTRLSLRATAHPSVDLGGAMAYLSKRQTFVRNAQRGDIKEPVLYDSVIDHVIRIMCKSEYEAKRKIGLVLTNFAEEFYDWNEAFEGATQISRDSMHMLASTHEYKVEGFNTNVNPSFSERSATWSPFGLPTVMSYLENRCVQVRLRSILSHMFPEEMKALDEQSKQMQSAMERPDEAQLEFYDLVKSQEELAIDQFTEFHEAQSDSAEFNNLMLSKFMLNEISSQLDNKHGFNMKELTNALVLIAKAPAGLPKFGVEDERLNGILDKLSQLHPDVLRLLHSDVALINSKDPSRKASRSFHFQFGRHIHQITLDLIEKLPIQEIKVLVQPPHSIPFYYQGEALIQLIPELFHSWVTPDCRPVFNRVVGMMTQIFELEKQRDSQSPPLPSVNKPEEIQELLWEKCDLYLQTYLQDWDTQGTSNPIEVQHVLDTLMKVMEGLNIDEPDDESIRSVSDNASSRSLTVSSSVRSMSSEQSSSPSVIERVDDLSRSRKCVNKMLSSLDDLVKLLAEKPQELAKVRVESLRQSFTDTTEI